MSHPAASIKSIFSGKVNLTDTEFDDTSPLDSVRGSVPVSTDEIHGYTNSRNDSQQEFPDRTMVNINNGSCDDTLADPAFAQGRNPREDSMLVSSKNLRIMALKAGDDEHTSSTSTNMSVASSDSDYQRAFVAEDDFLLDSSPEMDRGELISRPMSRNSTMLCLSTTATKDGIEGKKLHRHGPTPYFSNVIANMMHHQQSTLRLENANDARSLSS